MKFQKKTLESIVAALNTRPTYIDLPVKPEITSLFYSLQTYVGNIYSGSRYTQRYKYDLCYIENTFESIKTKLNQLSELETQLHEPLTVGDVKKDLEYLVKNFEEVKIRKVKNKPTVVITVITKDIEITYMDRTVNFGKFKITIPFNSNNIAAGETSFSSIKDPKVSVPHPHVCNKHMCFGDGMGAFNTCVKKNLISEAFDIIMGVLNNYNPGSPYKRFSHWVVINCSICKNRTAPDYQYTCKVCGEQEICNYCVASIKSKLVCKNCSTKCKQCGTYILKGTSEYCNLCEKAIEKEKIKTVSVPTNIPILETIIITNYTGTDYVVVNPTTTATTVSNSVACRCCRCNSDTQIQEHEGYNYCRTCLFQVIQRDEGSY
jgi:hypothetical protein